MPSSFRLFSAGSPFGPGRGAPSRRTRKQIADIISTVDGPAESSAGFDGPEDIFRVVRRFQTRRNLKPNGIVNPGGPTEGALNAFAVANDKGGPRLARAIAPAFDDLTKQGLSFTADPRNPEALGMWRDTIGRRVDPEQAGKLLRRTGPGAPDLDGKQQLFVERLVGKGGSAKVMKAGGVSDDAHSANSAGPGSAATTDGSARQRREGRGTPESAIDDSRLERGRRSAVGGSPQFRSLGIDMNADIAGFARPRPKSDDTGQTATPETAGVPDYLTELYRKRTNDRSNENALVQRRDSDGKIVRPGLSPSMMERNKGAEFTSVINRIRVADKLNPGDVQKLRRDIGKLPKSDASDVSNLRMYVDLMRGNVPSERRLEAVLSDEEVKALKDLREKQTHRLSVASGATGGMGMLSQIAPLSQISTLLGFFGLATARLGRDADDDLKMREQERHVIFP